MVNSRTKGAVGERKFRDFLRNNFGDDEAQRGQQKKGGDQSPDVESPFLRGLGIHPEVKFMRESHLTHRASLIAWLSQAKADAGPSLFPVVFHRWNRSEWWAIWRSKQGGILIQDAKDFLTERKVEHEIR